MKKILLLLLSAIITIGVQAQKLTSKIGTVPDSYNFWFYNPTDSGREAKEKKPLVVFLHGASLCGRNLERVRHYGTLDAIEKGRKIDAYVIAPQNPGGAWNPGKIKNIIDWAENSQNIDSDRIYVIGMSLGGYGTLDLVASYPDKFAAAIALCGGASVKNLDALNKLPLWIIHGTAARAVNISESDKVVAAMRSADGSTPRLVYNRVPGMNHSQPARMFYLKESYDWLFSHSLKDPERRVNKAFDVQSGILRTAYSDLSAGRTRVKVSAPSRSKVSKSKSRASRSKSSRRRRSS